MTASSPDVASRAVALVGNADVGVNHLFKAWTLSEPVFGGGQNQALLTSVDRNLTFYKVGNTECNQKWMQVGRELKQLRLSNPDLKIAFVVVLRSGRARYKDELIIRNVLSEFGNGKNGQFGVIINQLGNGSFSELEKNVEELPHIFSSLCVTNYWHLVRKDCELYDQRQEIDQAHQRLRDFVDGIGLAKDEQRDTETEGGTANVPGVSPKTYFNFDEKDKNGTAVTPEGRLKQAVLMSISSKEVTAATGKLKPGCGVFGMAGVGKTIALQGLARDKDIQKRFVDGVFYMSLGHAATQRDVIKQIAKVVRAAGAPEVAHEVEGSAYVYEAVNFAVDSFREKNCLILVDDMWRTTDRKTGFLLELRQLVRESPESRMAISTRSMDVALAAGLVVKFDAREPHGPVAVRIFMSHATGRSESCTMPASELIEPMYKILTICAGLPIALAIAGSGVALLSEVYGDFDRASDRFLKELEKGNVDLGEMESPEGKILNRGIHTSLQITEVEFSKLKENHPAFLAHTLTDLYASLCVMKSQAWVPVSVLSRMWCADAEAVLGVVHLLSRLCLCKLTYRPCTDESSSSEEEGGVMLHDLQLDFCKRRAKRLTGIPYWHSQLLNGYLPRKHECFTPCLLVEHFCLLLQRCWRSASFLKARKVAAFNPRPWWDASRDGYIHGNVSWHLSEAKMGLELAALLLDARWTHFRIDTGGILALESDMEYVNIRAETKRSLEIVWRTIRAFWGYLSYGKRAFMFQIGGRLFKLRRDDQIVNAFMKSLEMYTPKPFLLPVNWYLPNLERCQIMEIPVGIPCSSVSCSGRFIAAAGGADVVVMDSMSGEVLKRFQRHSDLVSCLSFDSKSHKIYSGCRSSIIGVWDWETTGSRILYKIGHCNMISAIAVSHDGERVFSCSADEYLMIWNSSTGKREAVLQQQDKIRSLAVAPDDETVAVGLENGTLHVLNRITGDCIFGWSNAHGNAVRSISFSPDMQWVATASGDRTIRVWSMAERTTVGELLEGHTGGVNSVAFSPDGQRIVSAAEDGTVCVWDVATRSVTWTSSTVRCVVNSAAFTPDGERIVSGSDDGFVRIWDPRVQSEEIKCAYGHAKGVERVAISRDGMKVASASHDRTVRLWNSRTAQQIGRPFKGHENSVWCLSFSPDGGLLASGGESGVVRLWDTATSLPIGGPLMWHSFGVTSVSFSSDGKRIISGSDDCTVCICDTASGELIGEKLVGGMRGIQIVGETDDGNFIAARDWYAKVVIWRSDDRKVVWIKTFEYTTFRNEISDDHALRILRSCGQQSPRHWPEAFPSYTGRVYCDGYSLFSNTPDEKTLLAILPSQVRDWKYDEESNVFVSGWWNGAVVLCKLK